MRQVISSLTVKFSISEINNLCHNTLNVSITYIYKTDTNNIKIMIHFG